MVAEKAGSLLAPVGTVFEKLRTENPDINLFWRDGEHAGPYGDLIIASVLYKLIGIRENWCTEGGEFKASVFDNSARDFAADIRIDFHHPCVLENKDEIEVRLDPEKTAAVFAAVDSVV
jgi:hypothetical protein